ncbi:cell division protein FtsZ [Hydrogenivirga caldilitoris]|uniref:Cell division protein FtsZ n=1 Tax=Hydrogenivirga caldilitoris TaxID=246264 RepID=A0A497XN30_9AQUI|nr:cell division protein FtsZ [Hydrogenivirga caldilitoris]RLJ70356.1 cell division protein FtsZ [Hydrogenivirga caldilitoris]
MESLNPTRIKVIGVGGGGCNAVNRMFIDGIEDVETYAVNTDVQHLSSLSVPHKIQIGEKVTRGLGAGARPEIGEQAALEDLDKIKDILKDTDMLFIAVGLGGGTGTGAAPVIAQTAREMGILTVGVATLPFKFEGPRRMQAALAGLDRLKDNVDTYIVIHNQKLQEIANKVLTVKDAFREVDNVLSKAVRGITNIISTSAMINVDFADVRTVMESGGLALIGMGEGRGEGKIDLAVEQAITSPLLEGNTIEGAKRLLVTLWVSEDIPFNEVEQAISGIMARTHNEPLIIFGAVLEENVENFLRVAVVATDFEKAQSESSREENLFRVIKREPPPVKRAVPEEGISPVEPEEEVPAYLRRKRKI